MGDVAMNNPRSRRQQTTGQGRPLWINYRGCGSLIAKARSIRPSLHRR